MFVLDAKSERIAALLLGLLMAATRIHHFGVGTIAPDASTGVFFLAGLLLASPAWFVVLAIEAILLDAVALGLVGVADACMTLGYWTLFAGYGALWYAGRLARRMEKLDVLNAGKLIGLAAVGTILFFVLSNVGYYFGGGFEQSMGAAEYVSRVGRYLPPYLFSTLGYIAAGIIVFIASLRLRSGGKLAAR
jgi:hypothetical protein